LKDSNDFYTSYNCALIENGRQLRKNMTRHEKHLWYDFLRSFPIKWYRQRPIDHYIVDFYCSKARLVLELDGSQHYTIESEEYDEIRTEILEAYQLDVMRISNMEIDRNFQKVCQMIEWTVEERLKTESLP